MANATLIKRMGFYSYRVASKTVNPNLQFTNLKSTGAGVESEKKFKTCSPLFFELRPQPQPPGIGRSQCTSSTTVGRPIVLQAVRRPEPAASARARRCSRLRVMIYGILGTRADSESRSTGPGPVRALSTHLDSLSLTSPARNSFRTWPRAGSP